MPDRGAPHAPPMISSRPLGTGADLVQQRGRVSEVLGHRARQVQPEPEVRPRVQGVQERRQRLYGDRLTPGREAPGGVRSTIKRASWIGHAVAPEPHAIGPPAARPRRDPTTQPATLRPMHPARRSRGPAHLGAHPCRLGMGARVLLLALLALALPRPGAALEWIGSTGEGRVLVEVSGPDGEVYERWRTWDGVERARPGILADLDPTPGRVSLRLDLVGPDCAARLAGATTPAEPGTAPATSRAVRVPPDARAVLLTHEDERHTTVVCAAARDGRVELPVTEGDLRGGVIGLPALRHGPGAGAPPRPRPRLWPRPPTETTPGPGGPAAPADGRPRRPGALGPGRTRRWPHLAWSRPASSGRARCAGSSPRRPPACSTPRRLHDAANSVATIAAVAESLTRLSDRSLAFAVPDGHTWLSRSAGAYALAAPLRGSPTPSPHTTSPCSCCSCCWA